MRKLMTCKNNCLKQFKESSSNFTVFFLRNIGLNLHENAKIYIIEQRRIQFLFNYYFKIGTILFICSVIYLFTLSKTGTMQVLTN